MIYPSGNVFICKAAANDEWGDACQERKLLLSPAPLFPPPMLGLREKSAKIFNENISFYLTMNCSTYHWDDLLLQQFLWSDHYDEMWDVPKVMLMMFWKIYLLNWMLTVVWMPYLDLYGIHLENFERNMWIEVTVMMTHQCHLFHALCFRNYDKKYFYVRSTKQQTW